MKTIKSLTEEELAELPKLSEDWKWIRLGETHILKSDKHKGSGESLFYVGLEHIKKDRGTLTEDVRVDVINTVKNSFKNGDLLYGKLRPYLNKVYLANEDGVCSTDILVFESTPFLNLNYSKYFFLSYKFVNDMTHNSSGVNLPRVSTKYLLEYPFPLAPFPEQRAIVSKIELLFSELDNGIANLKLAQEQLKVYRQAVLKKAFEGELTRKWREQQTDLPDAGDLLEQIRNEREEDATASVKKLKVVKPLTEVELAELPKLPERWGWVRLEEISTKITDGEHITPTRTESGYHLLSARNIQNGYLDLKNVDYVPKEEYFRIRNRCNPEEGDVLISCSGSIGRICSVPKNSEFVMVRSAALVKLSSKLKLNRFFEYQLQSPLLQSQIEKGKKATAQANLFLGPISNLKVVLCSLPERHAIVQEIETRLSVCDKIEQDIQENLEKAEALRQSILKKAFEGKLLNEREMAEVRRAEDWEPAKVLLEKIRKERVENGKR